MSFKLEELCLNIVDCEHKTAPTQEKGYPSVRTTNIRNGRIDFDGCNRVSEETYKEWTRRLVPEEGDLILTREAPVGEIGIIPKGQKPCLGQRTVLLRPDKKLVNTKYLLYKMLSPEMQQKMHSRSDGSVVSHLNMKLIRQLDIETLPNIIEQSYRAKILADVDEKIEVNNQINKTLEEMAQAIFKQWFVDFEFPNEDEEPYKSSGGEMVQSELGMIPKGWEVKSLDEIVQQIKPGTNYQPKRTECGIPFLNIKNVNKGYIDLNDVKYITEEDYLNVHKSWAPEENDILISRIGTLGIVAVIRKGDLPLAIHYNFINIKSKETSYQFIYFLLKSDFFQEQYHRIKKASVQEYVTIDEVKTLKIIMPPDKDTFKKLENSFVELLNKITLLQEQNIILNQIRDSLLPKLMSGEIRVPINE